MIARIRSEQACMRCGAGEWMASHAIGRRETAAGIDKSVEQTRNSRRGVRSLRIEFAKVRIRGRLVLVRVD